MVRESVTMLIDPALQQELDRLPHESRRPGGRPAREGAPPWRIGRRPEPRHRTRLERLFQRLFSERPWRIHLLLDASVTMTYAGSAPPVPSEKFAYAQKLAAALGYAALQRYDLVQVTAFAPSRGRRAPRLAHRADSPALLTYLEGLRPGGNTGFAKALRNLLARSHRGTYLILLSDFRDDHWLQGIRALLHGTARIALVHIQDRSDFSEPSVEAIDLVDPETGAARSMDGRPEPHRSREQPDTHLRRHLVELARHHGFDYVPVSLDTRFDEMLLRSLGLTENRGGS